MEKSCEEEGVAGSRAEWVCERAREREWELGRETERREPECEEEDDDEEVVGVVVIPAGRGVVERVCGWLME